MYKTVLDLTGDLLGSAITSAENEIVILAIATLSHCMKNKQAKKQPPTLELYQKNKAR